ncbi:hypothetical protein RJ639_024197 [Escallonia herrerae]|uniref:Transposase (putative) gypsy type domain-containing protein n=1 Tax=Escallonia herrerae TaxID=1293975 RepID=A0AA88V051_9ASTE|nr:hypothetical protein RJ639_024197 [Escallonia herrerae]
MPLHPARGGIEGLARYIPTDNDVAEENSGVHLVIFSLGSGCGATVVDSLLTSSSSGVDGATDAIANRGGDGADWRCASHCGYSNQRCERCEILPIIKLRLPYENESANMTTLDEIGVYWDMFINGFRVPLHPFFIRVLKVYGLAPGQFSPHAWRFMSFFIYQCHKLGSNPRSQRSEVNNVWLVECETRACNKLRETNLSETDLEHIRKLKGAEPLKSRYSLSNAQLCEYGIIFPPEPQDFADEADEEEEGKNDPGKALTKP